MRTRSHPLCILRRGTYRHPAASIHTMTSATYRRSLWASDRRPRYQPQCSCRRKRSRWTTARKLLAPATRETVPAIGWILFEYADRDPRFQIAEGRCHADTEVDRDIGDSPIDVGIKGREHQQADNQGLADVAVAELGIGEKIGHPNAILSTESQQHSYQRDTGPLGPHDLLNNALRLPERDRDP